MAAQGRFPTTMWTLVVNAGQCTHARSREALAALCERFWYPLYAYVRRRGYTVEQAQDLTQEFFARFLEKHYIERADRHKGRFRTFLLSSLTCFLLDEVDRRRALKRGGRARRFRLRFATERKSTSASLSITRRPRGSSNADGR